MAEPVMTRPWVASTEWQTGATQLTEPVTAIKAKETTITIENAAGALAISKSAAGCAVSNNESLASTIFGTCAHCSQIMSHARFIFVDCPLVSSLLRRAATLN